METKAAKLNSVCFTGHRELPEKPGSEYRALVRDTELAIEQAYEDGARVFYAGGAEGFDQLAAELVLRLRERDGSVKLVILLPYPGYNKGAALSRLLAAAESEELFTHYLRGCFLMRDKELVSRADACIAYLRKPKSGTAYTVSCARKKGIPVVLV